MTHNKTLIRTDRNGTKYWQIEETCPRCGGRGDYILGGLNHGICFLCGGKGLHEYKCKEYTPEHEAKLVAARQKRNAKRIEGQKRFAEDHAQEIIERTYQDYGCGKNGIGYVLTGNTYRAKNEIKKNGGRWIFGVWICPVEIKGKGIEAHQINLHGHVGSGSEEWLAGFDLYELIESIRG